MILLCIWIEDHRSKQILGLLNVLCITIVLYNILLFKLINGIIWPILIYPKNELYQSFIIMFSYLKSCHIYMISPKSVAAFRMFRNDYDYTF